MSERPSVSRRRRGAPSDTPFRGGPIFDLPTPIPSIAFWTFAAFFVSFLPSPFSGGPLIEDFAFVPLQFTLRIQDGAYALALVPLVTHVFLHGGIAHIVVNMLWLMVFGSGIARRLCVEGVPPADRARNLAVFMAFYLASGVAGGLAFYANRPFEDVALVGASGAISGLMAGTLRFALRLYAPMGAEYGRLSPMSARPVLVMSLVYVGLNLATGIAGRSGLEAASVVAWEAHVGGFLFGLIFFPLFDRLAKRPPLPFGLG